MELHTCLWNDVEAFDFDEDDFESLAIHFPDLQIKTHRSVDDFLATAHQADFLLTWDYEEAWYQACTNLKAIFTPAAGNEWVQSDPNNKVSLVHGTFHGSILAESLLSAILFMNHAMPDMIRNHKARTWDRNSQKSCSILRNQHVLMIGLGHIGSTCTSLIRCMGAEVIGVKRRVENVNSSDVEVKAINELEDLLPWADHVVLLLPGEPDTDRFMNPKRLKLMKPGSYIYNFGRGNALTTADLLANLDRLGGAFLDVVDEEPLPPNSPLWNQHKVMITPHSSCIYREYKSMFVSEVISHLKEETWR